MSQLFSWSLNLRASPDRKLSPHSLAALRAQQLLPKTHFEIEVLLPVGQSSRLRIRLWIWPWVLPSI
jgi:hypothetical protein